MNALHQAARLIENAPCSAVLPAGAGKTEILATACGLVANNGGRTLVLTHTNTGVAVLRRRLAKLGIEESCADIRTIAAWALGWCMRYPLLGEVSTDEDGFTNDYNTHYSGAATILTARAIAQVLRATWGLVLVDEYQDCTLPQHEIVLATSQSLPVVLVGDPLQSVYNFPKDPVVDWERDVFDAFGAVVLDWQPHRWANANVQLGADLLAVRRSLELGKPLDLRPLLSIRWTRASNPARIASAKRTADRAGTSLVVSRFRPQAVKLAKNTGGKLEAMEDLAGQDLIKLARALDTCEPNQRLTHLIRFAGDCISMLPADFKKRADAIDQGQTPNFKPESKLGPFTAAAIAAHTGEPSALGEVCATISELPGIVLARRELWTDLQRTVLLQQTDPDLTFHEAAQLVRSRNQARGPSNIGTSATTLLVKGLEYDNVLVSDADRLSTEELYVAMTRACRYLEVSSDKPIITPTSNRSHQAV